MAVTQTKHAMFCHRTTQVAWFALRKLGGASKTRENSLDAAEQGDLAGDSPSTSSTAVLTISTENNGGGGNAESPGRDTPADATALGLASHPPNGLGDEDVTSIASSEPRGVLLTGLGDDEDTGVSEMLVPLLPRGSGSAQNGNQQPSS